MHDKGNGAGHELGHGTPERVRVPKNVKGLPENCRVLSAAISSFSAFVSTCARTTTTHRVCVCFETKLRFACSEWQCAWVGHRQDSSRTNGGR